MKNAGCVIAGVVLSLLCAVRAADGDETGQVPATSVVITGTSVVSEADVRRAAGVPPSDPRARARWSGDAIRRVLRTYRERGYTFARAWYRIEPDGRSSIDVDEGRMAGIVFAGASTELAVYFRMDVVLPGGVFHKPTLEKTLEEIRSKYDLVTADYQVIEREERMPNAFGEPVTVRAVRVSVVRLESYGFVYGIWPDPSFGLVPYLGYRHAGLMLKGDRLSAVVGIGAPYRRLLFDVQPKVQWVHLRAGLSYRIGEFGARRLAPTVEGRFAFSQYSRPDVGLKRYFQTHWSALGSASIRLLPPVLIVSLGAGAQGYDLFSVDPVPDDAVPAAGIAARRNIVRGLVRMTLMADLNADDLRTNRKRYVLGEVTLGVPHGITPMVEGRLQLQYLFSFGFSDLYLRARGFWKTGGVFHFDEDPLGSEWQRVYFADRYWVRQAFQAEVAFRLSIVEERFKLGIFSDVSVFGDRTRPGQHVAVANGFGPSLHFLVLDQFAIDVFYGFGFAPVGFDHNLSASLGFIY